LIIDLVGAFVAQPVQALQELVVRLEMVDAQELQWAEKTNV
jgi:hypothetical protein